GTDHVADSRESASRNARSFPSIAAFIYHDPLNHHFHHRILFHFFIKARAHILLPWTACVTVSMEPRADQQSGRRAILVVDGDVQVRRLLELSLRDAGFDVRAVATASEALKLVDEVPPDLILSDARLEGGPDGLELCRRIKKRTEKPTIAFVLLTE